MIRLPRQTLKTFAPLHLCAFALIASLVCAATPASASMEDSIGLGPRATALGGSMAARAGNFSAVYYNPAGLVRGSDLRPDLPGFVELSLGFVFSEPVVSVTGFNGNELEPVVELPATIGLLFGTRFDLGHAFNVDGLNFGLSVFLPSNLFRWSIHPDDEIQWLFLTDRTQHVAISMGIGWQATPWLSLGVGLQVLFDVESLNYGRVTDVEINEDPQTGDTSFQVGTQLGEEVTVLGRASPTFGMTFMPLDELSFSLVYRARNQADDWGNTRIQGVPGLGDLGYNHLFAHYFSPHQGTVAVCAQVTPALSLSADLTYARWSEALTTNRNTFGTGYFGDTWRPAFGIEWFPTTGVDVLLGYQFVRTPYENFGGPTNLLENDRHVSSAGVTLYMGELFGHPEIDLSLSLAMQVSILPENEESKDFRRFESDDDLASNPGYPGYRYGGWIPAGVISFEAEW